MATPYSDIYDYFLTKISDYSFVQMSQSDLEDNLVRYLRSSVNNFKTCKQDLTKKDDALKQFNLDLTEEEKDILSTLMIIEYLKPKLITADLLQQRLGSKDFNSFSQANHIKELIELKNALKLDVDQMVINYSYLKVNLDDFK